MDSVRRLRLEDSLALFKLMAGVVTALALGALLVLGKDVLIYLALAIMLSFILGPAVIFLQRLGLARAAAVTLTMLVTLSIVAGLLVIVSWQFTALAQQLPAYQGTILSKVHALKDQISGDGVISRAASVIGRVLDDIETIGKSTDQPSVVISAAPEQGSSFLQTVEAVALPAISPIATLLVVMLLSGFILMQREDLRNRFIKLMGTEDIQKTTFALDDAGARVSRLLASQLALNFAFGVLISLGLYLIGVPSAALWGILAGIARFIPYIGAVIGALPPLAAAFAFDPGWTSFVLTAALFLLIEPLIGHVIEPLLYGRRVGLSPVAIIISAAVWAGLWGPIGLVLSTPITVCLVVLGRHVKRLAFLDTLLGDRPALKPHEIFYQRMLAGDPREAITNARTFLESRSKAAYYDQIALEALRRGHIDAASGALNDQHSRMLRDSMIELIAALDGVGHLRRRKRRRGRMSFMEAEAAFELIAAEVASRSSYPATASAQPSIAIAVLHGSHPLDEAAARMLAQVFDQAGYRAQVAAIEAAQEHGEAQKEAFPFVCLCHVVPASAAQLRLQVSAVRGALPKARILLCLWQKMLREKRDELVQKTRADHAATSISEALIWADEMIASGLNQAAPIPVPMVKSRSAQLAVDLAKIRVAKAS